MKLETTPTRSGQGLVVRANGKAVAWIDRKGGATVGRAYRAALGDKPVPAAVRKAITEARKRVREA